MFGLKVIIEHKNFRWIKDCHSFEHGIALAEDLHNRFGLIGRTYILCTNGKATWII